LASEGRGGRDPPPVSQEEKNKLLGKKTLRGGNRIEKKKRGLSSGDQKKQREKIHSNCGANRYDEIGERPQERVVWKGEVPPAAITKKKRRSEVATET